MAIATNSVKAIKRALEKGFAARGKKVGVWADKSDYKDFIRMYVVSDYFREMSEKERLGEIYSMLESYGAKGLIRKISLCIAMTRSEFEKEFGDDFECVFFTDLGGVYRDTKPRPRLRRLARVHSRN